MTDIVTLLKRRVPAARVLVLGARMRRLLAAPTHWRGCRTTRQLASIPARLLALLQSCSPLCFKLARRSASGLLPRAMRPWDAPALTHAPFVSMGDLPQRVRPARRPVTSFLDCRPSGCKPAAQLVAPALRMRLFAAAAHRATVGLSLQMAWNGSNPYFARISAINGELAARYPAALPAGGTAADGPSAAGDVAYLDCGGALLAPYNDGKSGRLGGVGGDPGGSAVLDREVFGDLLHLTPAGYRRWAACMQPVLSHWLAAARAAGTVAGWEAGGKSGAHGTREDRRAAGRRGMHKTATHHADHSIVV